VEVDYSLVKDYGFKVGEEYLSLAVDGTFSPASTTIEDDEDPEDPPTLPMSPVPFALNKTQEGGQMQFILSEYSANHLLYSVD
jgi:hypothetical protein